MLGLWITLSVTFSPGWPRCRLPAMSDFQDAWLLSRKRFDEAVTGLNQEQLNWRMHPGTLTIGEMALHVVGVELWFTAQITHQTLNEMGDRLCRCATDGVVNELPFPFSPDQITPELVSECLGYGAMVAEPMLAKNGEEDRIAELTSALGPQITGAGAMARLAFHAGYHQGQCHLIKTSPGFPHSGPLD